MKKVFIYLVIIFTSLNNTFAQNKYTLIASRNGGNVVYKVGDKFKLHYNRNDSSLSAKGMRLQPSVGNVLTFSNHKHALNIPISDLIVLKKVNTRKRWNSLALSAASMALGLTAIYAFENRSQNSNTNSSFNYIVGLPFIGASLFYAYRIPITFIQDKLKEHKRINNWNYRLK